MASLPSCASGSPFAVDVRSCNLSALDLSSASGNAACVVFDDRAVWPPADRMPGGFEPRAVLEANASPGLRLRQLHTEGVTGRGVGIALFAIFIDGGFEGLGRPPETDPDRFDSYGHPRAVRGAGRSDGTHQTSSSTADACAPWARCSIRSR